MAYSQREMKDKVVHMIACLNEYKTNSRRMATLLAEENNSAHKAGYYAGYTMSMDLVDETTKKLTELLLNFMDAVEKIVEVCCHFFNQYIKNVTIWFYNVYGIVLGPLFVEQFFYLLLVFAANNKTIYINSKIK